MRFRKSRDRWRGAKIIDYISSILLRYVMRSINFLRIIIDFIFEIEILY